MKILGNKSLSAILAVCINVLWWIEWAAYAIIICVIIIASFFKDNVSLDVPVTFSPVTFKNINAIAKNIPGGQLKVMSGNYVFNIPVNLQNTLILLAGFTLAFSLFILVTYQLKIIFSNLKKNLPFNNHNISRTRNIGIVLITASFLQWLFNIILNQFLIAHFKWEDGTVLTYRFNITYMIAGVLLIIIAEIVKQGVSLDEENKLTI